MRINASKIKVISERIRVEQRQAVLFYGEQLEGFDKLPSFYFHRKQPGHPRDKEQHTSFPSRFLSSAILSLVSACCIVAYKGRDYYAVV